MGSEHPRLRSDREPTGRPPIDLIGASVQIALLFYLMPVILLVAAIGVSSIVVARAVRGVRRAATRLKFDLDRLARPAPRPDRRAIGFRPITRPKKLRGSRIIR
jgi:hypothetical protein